MLGFEAALARAQASTGLIPKEVVADIEADCRVELCDVDELAVAIGNAGNSAISLVKALGKQIAARSETAERHVNMGATSQDVMDSGPAWYFLTTPAFTLCEFCEIKTAGYLPQYSLVWRNATSVWSATTSLTRVCRVD